MPQALAPIEVAWNGQSFCPTSAFWAKRAAKQYAEGEVIHIINQEPRSGRSHRFYFACVNAAWENLPDHWKELLPSPEHLRAFALCRAGYCDTQVMTLSEPEVAQTVVDAMRGLDPFAVVDVNGSVVTLHVPHSQNYRAMDKARFRESADAVLREISAMIGVSADQLQRAAKEAA